MIVGVNTCSTTSARKLMIPVSSATTVMPGSLLKRTRRTSYFPSIQEFFTRHGVKAWSCATRAIRWLCCLMGLGIKHWQLRLSGRKSCWNLCRASMSSDTRIQTNYINKDQSYCNELDRRYRLLTIISCLVTCYIILHPQGTPV